jgi:hypothetical protein
MGELQSEVQSSKFKAPEADAAKGGEASV